MRYSKLLLVVVAAVLATAVAGCGGGGHGLRTPSNPVIISSNALPNTLSGQAVNFSIPFTGGAGGPYMLEVISGAMPQGVELDSATVALTGQMLEAGTFDFQLKLTDLGTSPATTSIMTYEWVVGVGALAFITDAALPSWVYNRFDVAPLVVAGGVPPYSAQYIDDPLNPNDEPLPPGLSIPPSSTSVVGAPTGIKLSAPFVYRVTIQARDSAPVPATVQKEFIITVQVPPVVITTTSLSNGTCGTPYVDAISTADGIPPFLHSIVHVVPPVGTRADDPAYRMQGEAAVSGYAKGSGQSAYEVETNTATTYNDRFPEGIYIRDTTGDILGVPRRRGTYQNWTYVVQSTTLVFVASQNESRVFSFSMSDSYPGTSLGMSGAATILGTGQGYVAPNNFLKNAEFGRTYDYSYTSTGGVPQDGRYDAPHESQALNNALETIGACDWSTTTFALADPSTYNMKFEASGRFHTLSATGATAKFGPRNVFPRVVDAFLPTFGSPPTGHSATATNQFSIGPDVGVVTESLASASGAAENNAMQYADQTVEIFEAFTLSPVVRNPTTSDLTVGHDTSAGTNPTASNPGTNFKNWDFLTVTVNPTWWAYDAYNLCAKSARGAQNADPERTYMAQAFGSDGFRKNTYYGTSPEIHAGTYAYGYSTPYTPGFEHAGNLAVDLPNCTTPGVTHDPLGTTTGGVGQYTDGGLLYAFSRDPSATTGQFGVMIVRRDGRIYVPFSWDRSFSPSLDGFGDGCVGKGASVPSSIKQPQMTVSPDGRFGAMKLKKSVTTWNEAANGQKIVIFSLTGEKFFSGRTWRMIDPGPTSGTAQVGNRNPASSSPSSLGYYFYGDSLTLTNRYLYYVTGNYGDQGTATSYQHFNVVKEHWLWHYDLTGSATVGSLINASSTDPTNWPSNANTGGYPLQSPFHSWGNPGCSSYSLPTTGYYSGQNGTGTNSPGTSGPAPNFFAYNWANFGPSSKAVHPFRVSANGKLCAFLASFPFNPSSSMGYQSSSYPYEYSSTTNSSSYSEWYAVWTEFDGGASAGTLPTTRRITSASAPVRHFRPPARGGMAMGNEVYQNTGWGNGPATQFEVSDDGTRVASVWSDPAMNAWGYTYWAAYTGNYSTSTPYDWCSCAESVMTWVGTGGSTDPWAVSTELHVTRTPTTGGANMFPNPTSYEYWRFGCLSFTRDGNGLVFWGGFSYYGYTYGVPGYQNNVFELTGTLYAAKFSGTSVTSVAGIISSTSSGASTEGAKTYWNGSSVSSSTLSMSAWTPNQGSITPTGTFHSNDGNFFYVVAEWGIDSSATPGTNNSGATSHRLIGVNVASASGGAINGKSPLVAFNPAMTSGTPGWRRGFGPVGGGYSYDWYYQYLYGGTYDYYYYISQTAAHRLTANMSQSHAIGNMVSARAPSNLVFWAGYLQMGYDQTYDSYYTGYLPTVFGGGANASGRSDFGINQPEVMGFDAGVGGDPFQLSSLGTAGTEYGCRTISYMQPDQSGSRLMFVESDSYPVYSYPYGPFDHQANRERLWLVSNIATSSSGALTGSLGRVNITTAQGRCSSVMSPDSIGGTVYYGYVSGTGANENQMDLTQATIGAGGNSVAGTRTVPGILGGSGGKARWAVLWMSR